MKCPNCGSENSEASLCCDLCQMVLRKEKSATPPPAAAPAPAAAPVPKGPADLHKDGAVAELLVIALELGKENRFPEAAKLMSRVYDELEPAICKNLIVLCGQDWLKVEKLTPDETASAQSLIVSVSTCIAKREYGLAMSLNQALMNAVKTPTAEGMRLQLLLLGIKGAVVAAKAKATVPEPVEPKALESIDSWRDLILLANHRAVAGDAKEAARLMTRLFCECSLKDCERIIVAACDAYLEATVMPAEKAASLRARVFEAARLAGIDDFPSAHAIFKGIISEIQIEVGPSMKFGLIALGVKGAAAMKKRN